LAQPSFFVSQRPSGSFWHVAFLREYKRDLLSTDNAPRACGSFFRRRPDLPLWCLFWTDRSSRSPLFLPEEERRRHGLAGDDGKPRGTRLSSYLGELQQTFLPTSPRGFPARRSSWTRCGLQGVEQARFLLTSEQRTAAGRCPSRFFFFWVLFSASFWRPPFFSPSEEVGERSPSCRI